MSIAEKIRAKLVRKTSYLRGDAQHKLGADKLFFRAARGSSIIVYHGICKSDNTLFLTDQTFEAHLNIVALDNHKNRHHKYVKPTPSFPIIIKDMGTGLQVDKIAFTLADIDIF